MNNDDLHRRVDPWQNSTYWNHIMNRSFESLTLGKAIILPLLCCLLSACGSSWRLHDEMTLQIGALSDEAAPDWVKGKVPMDPERIYFVQSNLRVRGHL